MEGSKMSKTEYDLKAICIMQAAPHPHHHPHPPPPTPGPTPTPQRVLWPTWYKIRKQKAEYCTNTIVTMRVAKDVVDADMLVARCRVL